MTPDSERLRIALAKAKAAAADARSASGNKRQRLEDGGEAHASFMSPPSANGAAGSGAPPKGDTVAPTETAEAPLAGKTTVSSEGTSNAHSASAADSPALDAGACISEDKDGLIFKLTDDLTIKLMSGTTKQGKKIHALLGLMGAADWPEGALPERNLCVCYLTLLRGVATVGWSEVDKKFTLDGYVPSVLNPPTPWSSSVDGEVGAAAGSEADADAGGGGDLKAGGGAPSTAPEPQTEQ